MANRIIATAKAARAKLNVVGILVILGVGLAAGWCFKGGDVAWGLVFLFGGGFLGMCFAWINRPEG